MALRLDPALRETYAEFYDFALDMACPEAGAAVFEGLEDDAALCKAQADAQSESVTHVLVKDCPKLTQLNFLGLYPQVRYVGVWRCKALAKLPQMQLPRLEALAVVDCKKLTDFSGITRCAPTLRHLFLQCGTWNAVVLESLDPFASLSHLRTFDLACRGVKKGGKLDFKTLYPELESLTVTPNLCRWFVTGEGRR